MIASGIGNLLWFREEAVGDIQMGVEILRKEVVRELVNGQHTHVRISNLSLPWAPAGEFTNVVYRYPIRIRKRRGQWATDGVYAVLTGAKEGDFAGNRGDFRALIQTAKARRQFLYVLPVTSVDGGNVWQGYLRAGRHRWIPLPCPRPEAVYNRITLRNLEKSPQAVRAKEQLEADRIPLFNPSYFSKADIYQVISRSSVAEYLPETNLSLNRSGLLEMLSRHKFVYLKPSGGSVGHGILRVDREETGYRVSVLKRGETRNFTASNIDSGWRLVKMHRLPGPYVIQSGKTLLRWQGNPCDFRVLLQKHQQSWHVVGIGVRVAGEGVITTHVPNGGHIAAATNVLQSHFGDRADQVEQELRNVVVKAAEAIDDHYQQRLGEMSMDMAVEDNGRIWFLEANSKPMKFDEPSIRKSSLTGVLGHLDELKWENERTGNLL